MRRHAALRAQPPWSVSLCDSVVSSCPCSTQGSFPSHFLPAQKVSVDLERAHPHSCHARYQCLHSKLLCATGSSHCPCTMHMPRTHRARTAAFRCRHRCLYRCPSRHPRACRRPSRRPHRRMSAPVPAPLSPPGHGPSRRPCRRRHRCLSHRPHRRSGSAHGLGARDRVRHANRVAYGRSGSTPSVQLLCGL